jgi:hypothetical protein
LNNLSSQKLVPVEEARTVVDDEMSTVLMVVVEL